jgi:hypothetical protein
MFTLFKKKFFLFNLIIVIFSIIFFYIFSDPFFLGDDFTMLYFRENNFYESFILVDNWWRPFKNVFYNYFNNNYFLNAKYILICKYLIHCLISYLVYFFFKKNFNNYAEIFALIFFVHQSSVLAVFGVDTVEQEFMSLFGILSFISLHYFSINKKIFFIFISLFFFILALLSKENGVVFLFINCLFLLLISKSSLNFFKSNNSWLNNKKLFLYCLSYVSLFLLYFLLRYLLGAKWSPQFGDDRYNINILSSFFNFIKYYYSIFNPVDNSIIYFLVKNNFYINFFFTFSLFFLIYFLFLILRNLIKSIQYFLIFFISCGPVIILNHISELYTYHSIFFFCLLLINIFNIKEFKFISLHIFIIYFFVAISALSTISKIQNINKNSLLVKNIHNYILSNNKQIYFYLPSTSDYDKYSIYYFNSIENLLPRFYFRDFYQIELYPLPFYIHLYNYDNNVRIIREVKFENNKIKSLNDLAKIYNQEYCFNFLQKDISLKKICNF